MIHKGLNTQSTVFSRGIHAQNEVIFVVYWEISPYLLTLDGWSICNFCTVFEEKVQQKRDRNDPHPLVFNTLNLREGKKKLDGTTGGSWQQSKCGLWLVVECQHQTYCGLCSLTNPCCESSCTCTWGTGCLWNQGWSFSLTDSGISLEISLKRDDTSK